MVEMLVIVNRQDGRYDRSEDGLVFWVDFKQIVVFPSIEASSRDSEDEIDDIFVYVPQGKMS